MALTKVSRGLLSTGIVDNSNATAITLNADESATFAGAISVTGTATAGSLLTTGAIASTAVDGTVVDRSGNTSRFVAGRSGGNYAGLEMHVAGASGVTKRFSIDYDSTTKLFAPNGTSEHLVVTSAGLVGIGTSSLSGGRHLTIGNVTAPAQSFQQNGTEKFLFGISGTNNGGVTGSASGDYFARTAGGKMLFSTDDGVTAHAVIDSSGNVKIGDSATDITSKLVVSGNANANVATFMYDGSAGTFLDIDCGAANGDVTIAADARSGSYPPLVFKTGATERIHIDGATGNVGVSVIPPAWGSAYANVNVGTSASFWGSKTGASLAVMSDNSYFNGSAYIARNTGAGSKYFQNAGAHYWDRAASVSAGAAQSSVVGMTLDISGMLAVPQWHIQTTALGATAYIASGPQGGIYRSTSSIKYKRDVETIEDIYADAVLDVRPVFYRSKSDNDNSAHGFWGIIAEELAEIDPRLVHWQTHVPVESTDDDGVVTTEMVELDTPEPEGVQYERFVPLLINLAKRQRDQITAQAAAITDLTTRLTALEN